MRTARGCCSTEVGARTRHTQVDFAATVNVVQPQAGTMTGVSTSRLALRPDRGRHAEVFDDRPEPIRFT